MPVIATAPRRARTTSACLALGVGLSATLACAQDDVDRIPSGLLDATPAVGSGDVPASTRSEGDASASPASRRLYVEANDEQITRRATEVPRSSGRGDANTARLLLDARADWRASGQVSLRLSGRLGWLWTHDDGTRFGTQADLREAAVQWRMTDSWLVELGRINLRQGVAQGFNPTDYFKPGTTIDTTTRDPQAQRNNRLGTVMLMANWISRHASLQAAYAPRLSEPASLLGREPIGRLRLADTNGEDRLLLKMQFDAGPALQPELLAFKDAGGWRYGLNLTHAFGNRVTGFLEHSIGRRRDVLYRSLEQGVAAGDLPPQALQALPDPGRRWLNDLAIGATWTGDNRLSVTAEFDYQQGGPSRAGLDQWAALGRSTPEGALLAWYLRGAAADRLDPMFRRNLFLRLQWDPVGWRDVSLSGFVARNLDDHSDLGQVAIEYRWTQNDRFRLMGLFTRGSRSSQNGSDPVRLAVLLGYQHFL